MTHDELAACESIRRTLARYNQAGDRDLAEAYAACFTPEGLFEAPGFRHEGRAAILAWKQQHRIFGAAAFRQHHMSTTQIELDLPDQAEVISNWVAFTNIGPDHCGRYFDRFRRCADEWLIAHRRVEIYWRAADSFLGEEHLSS